MAGYAKCAEVVLPTAACIGFAIIVIILLVSSKVGLHLVVQHRRPPSCSASERVTLAMLADAASSEKGSAYTPPFVRLSAGSIGQSMLLVPMLMFYLLWPNWGTTLYGEIRWRERLQARVQRHVHWPVDLPCCCPWRSWRCSPRHSGSTFYQDANALWADSAHPITTAHALPVFPYPVMMAWGGWYTTRSPRRSSSCSCRCGSSAGSERCSCPPPGSSSPPPSTGSSPTAPPRCRRSGGSRSGRWS